MTAARRGFAIALGAAGLVLAGAPSGAAGGSFTVCGEAGKILRFTVAFNAYHENAVTITDLSAKQDVATFNNYFGRGAGSEWRMGAGAWATPMLKRRTCYAVKALNKSSPPNAARPWRESAVRQLESNRWGFDDGVDSDYNDAVVSVARVPIDDAVAQQRRRAEEARRPRSAETPARPAAAPPAQPRMAVPAPELPQFSPWPPPQASARHVIPIELVTGKGTSSTWGAVTDRFDNALGKVGYRDSSYYAVPNGFALATRVERMEIDGGPAPQPSRWVVEEGALSASTWTLEGVLRRLAGAPLGHYRAIVFVFSPDAFRISGTPVTQAQADEWRKGGLNRLPKGLRANAYTADFRCDVLVYEFEQQAENQPARLVAGRLSGETHLRKAKILDELRRAP